MARLTQQQAVGVKKESTYGTDAVLDGTNVIDIIDPKFDDIRETVKREILNSSLSMFQSIAGKGYADINCVVELKGSGSAGTAPEVGALLQACSMTETVDAGSSVVYTLNSADDPASVTYEQDADGVLHQALGARFSFDLGIVSGEMGKYTFKGQGLYATPIDATLPIKSGGDTTIPPLAESCSLTIGGDTVEAREFNISLNNQLSFFESLNQSANIKEVRVVKREPSVSIKAEAVLEATKDWYTEMESATQQAFSLQIGSSAGNIIIISGYLNVITIKQEDVDGIMYYQIEAELARNSSAGNDELQIIYK